MNDWQTFGHRLTERCYSSSLAGSLYNLSLWFLMVYVADVKWVCSIPELRSKRPTLWASLHTRYRANGNIKQDFDIWYGLNFSYLNPCYSYQWSICSTIKGAITSGSYSSHDVARWGCTICCRFHILLWTAPVTTVVRYPHPRFQSPIIVESDED